MKGLDAQGSGRRVLHQRISDYPVDKRTRDNLSRAIGVLQELKAKRKGGEIFLLRNADLIFIATAPAAALTGAGRAIESLFLGTDVDSQTRDCFQLFELPQDFGRLQEWAEKASGIADAVTNGTDQQAPREAVDLSMLGQIKERLQRVDISTMLFSQPVYDVTARKPEILFRENYVSVRTLEDNFCPGQSLTASRWLFADLTADLDAAVLRFLADGPSEKMSGHASININLSSLASNEFVDFDSRIPPERRRKVILEITKTDVFENMRLYRELVPFLRQRGYRLLLDGLSFLNVAAIDFSGIDCDFAKIFWSGEAENLDQETLAFIGAKIRAPGAPRFVLARCDGAESVRVARSLGIDLAQGRLIDALVRRDIPL